MMRTFWQALDEPILMVAGMTSDYAGDSIKIKPVEQGLQFGAVFLPCVHR